MEGFFMALISIIAAIFMTVIVTSDETTAARGVDCDNFGAFMVDDVKYECRRVGK